MGLSTVQMAEAGRFFSDIYVDFTINIWYFDLLSIKHQNLRNNRAGWSGGGDESHNGASNGGTSVSSLQSSETHSSQTVLCRTRVRDRERLCPLYLGWPLRLDRAALALPEKAAGVVGSSSKAVLRQGDTSSTELVTELEVESGTRTDILARP